MMGARVCLVLAAGVGRRIGGPKALLGWEGVPLAAAHAQARAKDCGAALVVTRGSIAEVLQRCCPWVAVLLSTEPDELGPAGSIAAAVRSGALDGAEQVVVTPVDVPPGSTQVVEALCAALGGAQAARPWVGDRPGHPVACRAELLRRHYASAAPPLRDVLAGLGAQCARVQVNDPDCLIDFDTPEAFAARSGQRPRFF
jgi:CTP:molybdopterin cytidylyltransferase MocA